MPLDGAPPPRIRTAELPHPALASGDDAKPPQRIRMIDAGRRQPAVDQPRHPVPGDAARLAAPRTARDARAGPPGSGTDAAPGCSWARRSSGSAHQRPRPATCPPPGSGSCIRRCNSALTSVSFACNRLRIVCRRTVKRPLLRFVAQMCVKPRKLNVSGLPCPRFRRFSAANGPNSISRVLSGCSSSPNLANRCRKSARNRSASARCWNPTTKSSA